MIRILLAALLALVTCSPAFSQAALGITPCTASVVSGKTSLSVSSVSANVQLPPSTCGPTAIVYNITSQEVFYALGTTSATAATTSGFSIPGGYYVVLNVGTSGLWLAAITATSTSTLRIVSGKAQ